MEGEEVWVAHGHCGWGEEARVVGLYDSREAAFEGLKKRPNMTVYVDDQGRVQGRPKKQDGLYFERMWATAWPMTVQGRQAPDPQEP